jgi:hypothetical protein
MRVSPSTIEEGSHELHTNFLDHSTLGIARELGRQNHHLPFSKDIQVNTATENHKKLGSKELTRQVRKAREKKTFRDGTVDMHGHTNDR